MPLDDRLRDALHSTASSVEPDVEHHLERVQGRSRRTAAPFGRLALASVAVIAVVVAVRTVAPDPVAMVVSMLGMAPTVVPITSAGPVDASDALAGTYRARLDGSHADVDAHGLAGEWELTLGDDSSVALTAPGTFVAPTDEPLTGYLYALRGTRVFTNLLARHFERGCTGSGTYEWESTSDGLDLSLVEDACEPRVALLTSGTWSRIGDPDATR